MPASTMELRCLLLFGEVPGLIEWLASDAPPADTYDLLRVAENMQTLAFACWHCVRLNNKLPPSTALEGLYHYNCSTWQEMVKACSKTDPRHELHALSIVLIGGQTMKGSRTDSLCKPSAQSLLVTRSRCSEVLEICTLSCSAIQQIG